MTCCGELVMVSASSRSDRSQGEAAVAPGFDFADFRMVSTLEDHERHFAGPLRELNELL